MAVKPDTINRTVGKKYQQFINSKLPSNQMPLIVDGECGRMTTAMTYLVFQNKNASAITDDQYDEVAALLKEPNTTRIRTVAQVESAGSGWDKYGFPIILFERHYFWQLTNGRVGITQFSNPARNTKYTIDTDGDGINDSWEDVTASMFFDASAAFQSFSMSKFQIMGKWYDKLGFNEPWEMAYEVSRGEHVHYKMMANWILLNNRLNSLKAISGDPKTCAAFAQFWNGGAYATHNYHGRLAAAYKSLAPKYGK